MAGAGYPNILVLEYALGGDAHIETLARLARPDIAVVTTIGPAHLQYLKTVEAVAEHKGALIRAVPPGGLVILGDNHPLVDRLQAMARAPVVRVPGRGIDLAVAIARVIARRLENPDLAVHAALARSEERRVGKEGRWSIRGW